MLLQNDEFRSAPYMSNLELYRISSFWSNICISIQMLLSFEMILKIEPKNVKKRFFTNVTHILKLYQTHLLSISSDVVMDN